LFLEVEGVAAVMKMAAEVVVGGSSLRGCLVFVEDHDSQLRFLSQHGVRRTSLPTLEVENRQIQIPRVFAQPDDFQMELDQ
jgi:hypothetical protein